jgi:hypothetical protein
MLAVHMPAPALRAIAAFAALEFDVCLRDCALPFVRDAPAAVFASRVSPAGALLGAAARVPPQSPGPSISGKLCQLVSFYAAPLGLPLALASYEHKNKPRLPVLFDLSSFPPRQFAAAPPDPDGWSIALMLRRALTAVLGGAWTPWPASPRTILAADTDAGGLRLFWLELPAAGLCSHARLLRTVRARLDQIPFATDPLPLMADPAGRYVFVATQSLHAATCLKICARSGTVLASAAAQGTEPGHLVPLAPDLWLHLAGEDTALLSATAPPRPQPDFWRRLAALFPDEQEATQRPAHTYHLRARRKPWRMSRGRVLVPDPTAERLVLAELRGLEDGAPAMHLCGLLPDHLPPDAVYSSMAPVCEGPGAEQLVIRGAHSKSIIVRETHGARLEIRSMPSLPVMTSQHAADPRLAAVFEQARRQQERRVAAAAAAHRAAAPAPLPCLRPGDSAACPIDLSAEE